MKRVGDYVLERELTPGGERRMFAATRRGGEPGLLAVKFPTRDRRSTREKAAARLENEASTLLAIGRHLHIVSAVEFKSGFGEPYLVLEMPPGEFLLDRLKDGALSEDEAVGITLMLLEGLGVVHASGYLHADIRPENVHLSEDGRAILTGFECAVRVDEDGTARAEEDGTLGYSAPELLRSGAIDRRADIHAIGALLYEMLVGKPPFEDDRYWILEQVAPLDLASVPTSLKRILRGALAKRRDERYDSCADMAKAIYSARSSEPAEPEGAYTVSVVSMVKVAKMLDADGIRGLSSLLDRYQELTQHEHLDALDGALEDIWESHDLEREAFLQTLKGSPSDTLTDELTCWAQKHVEPGARAAAQDTLDRFRPGASPSPTVRTEVAYRKQPPAEVVPASEDTPAAEITPEPVVTLSAREQDKAIAGKVLLVVVCAALLVFVLAFIVIRSLA